MNTVGKFGAILGIFVLGFAGFSFLVIDSAKQTTVHIDNVALYQHTAGSNVTILMITWSAISAGLVPLPECSASVGVYLESQFVEREPVASFKADADGETFYRTVTLDRGFMSAEARAEYDAWLTGTNKTLTLVLSDGMWLFLAVDLDYSQDLVLPGYSV